jgi:hypothetical protein
MTAGRPPASSQTPAQRKHAAQEQARYQAMPPSAKKDVVRNRDREAQQAADNRRHERHRDERNAKNSQRQREAGNTTEVKARATVAVAKATGRLKQPAKCQSCGKTGPTEAHHADHSKPLDVTWKCSTCHGETRQTTGSA